MDQATINKKIVDMLRFQAQMTTELREQIIRYKAAIMTAHHRTPVFSGYFIYKAFIDEGLRDPEQVSRYLLAHNIKLD